MVTRALLPTPYDVFRCCFGGAGGVVCASPEQSESKVRAKCSSLGIEQTKAWKNIGNWPGWDSADTDWNVALKGSDLKSSFDASNPWNR